MAIRCCQSTTGCHTVGEIQVEICRFASTRPTSNFLADLRRQTVDSAPSLATIRPICSGHLLFQVRFRMANEPQQDEPQITWRPISIAVVGDLFREKYQFPTSRPSGDSPIAWPEAMRGRASVSVTTVESGAVLHAEAIKGLFQSTFFWDEKRPPANSPQVIHFDYGNVPPDWRSFGTYLHELGTFPSKESSRSQATKVWRISNTLGLVQDTDDDNYDGPSNSGAVRDTAPRLKRIPYLTNQLSEAVAAIKRDANDQHALLLVVNDRNQGFRDLNTPIEELVKACEPYKENHLILWHIRRLGGARNYFLHHLANSSSRHNTIVVINQQCLRDEGVNIRFDVSFEHTFADLLSFSLRHRLLHDLLRFPQLLIRFDYGVLHITTDAEPGHNIRQCEAFTHSARIITADAHGMVGGPFYASPKRHGIMTGRTFLLVAGLICELAHWYNKDHRVKLFDAIRMEGCERRSQAYYDAQSVPLALDQIMRDPAVPSILRSTVLDQGIDVGILLNAAHFYHGFGEFKSGKGPKVKGKDSVAKHFQALFDSFKQDFARLEQKGNVPAKSPNALTPFGFTYQHQEPEFTRLTRFSLDPDLLKSDHTAATRRERFSRVTMLGYRDIVALAETPPQSGVSGRPSYKGAPRFEADVLEGALRRIVRLGIWSVLGREPETPGALPEPSVVLPFVQFGDDLVTLDRQEIDGFLSIRFLVESYIAKAQSGNAPLSIGVFGPPGSGKNFTVNQILKSVFPGSPAETINLSQLTSVKDLARAFHRIQDRALANEVPIAFFDEFDCSFDNHRLGWLKFFLSPMQDGKFYDGDETFHVGPALFVFSGGTAPTFGEFVKKCERRTQEKGPDFISRLRGHLDVHDISAMSNCDSNNVDGRLQVRRALLLRSLLLHKAPSIFGETGEIANIDDAVVDAFMLVPSFKHGVRSMEAIIDMARIGDAGSFQKSALPTKAQLAMHVDADRFLDLVNRARDDSPGTGSDDGVGVTAIKDATNQGSAGE